MKKRQSVLQRFIRFIRPESLAHARARVKASLAADHRVLAWQEIFKGGEYGFARNWK